MKEPKTPHEEVMFVVESTNDIVSEILVSTNKSIANIKKTNDIVSKILEILEKPKVKEETLQELARRHGLGVG